MAGTVTFTIDDAFKAMVEQAERNSHKLIFVKDQGLYLMAPGKEGPAAEDNKVVYANGFNPEVDDFDEWYDRAAEICGGDDFAEYFETDFFRHAINGKAKNLRVKVTSRTIDLQAA